MKSDVPAETFTFLFTDIEGSTRLSQTHPAAMSTILARHHAILRAAIEAHHGHVFHIIGDSFSAAFHNALDALNAALAGQRSLRAETWGETGPIRVRMGLHTGMAKPTEDTMGMPYTGYSTLASAQRIMSAAHGGQILISQVTRDLLGDVLPSDVTLLDVGEHRLKDLLRPIHLYQVAASDLPADFPPLKTLDVSPHNLPVQLTSFIGREQELSALHTLLQTQRLITMTGPGGIGKTRLSLQVASKVLHQFQDGVWFIELAPLTSPDLIPQTILSTLHLGEQAGKTPLKVLEEQLIHKKLLLILDNCEHLIADSARVAHALLKATAEVKILVTSREVLSIAGEIAWRVPSLALPDSKSTPDQLTKYEAVRLFVDRALSVQPHLNLDETSMLAVAQICSRLDGIPLAIELAAARVNTLGVKHIARRLDDRFRLLTKGSRIVPERHQTLRAAIDWSYNLLDMDEARLLVRLSVFMGGWTIEAAEQICVTQRGEFEVLDVLSDLTDKSLVSMDGSTGEARYYLLETTRQYALEKLAESAEDKRWRDQHLAYFLALAEKGHTEITGPRQAEVIDLLDAELDNFRAALDWCVSNQYVEPALQMLGALGWAWDMRGYYNEVRSWFEKIRVRGNCASYPEAYARLLNHLGRFAADFDHRPDAESILEESRAIWLKVGTRGEQGLAEVLCFLGMNADNKGNLDRAESFYRESLPVAQRCNHQRIIAGTTLFLGIVEYQRGNFSRAMDLYQQGLELAQRAGDLLLISLAGENLGELLVQQGNYEKARPLMERGLEINEKLRFRFGLAATWINFTEYYRHQGNYVQAEHCIEKSTRIARDLGLKERISYDLYLFGLLALHQNRYSSAAERFMDYFDFDRVHEEKVSLCRFLTAMSSVAAGTGDSERCARLFGAAQVALGSFPDFRMDPIDRAEFDRHIQIAREQLSRTRFDALSKEGQAISIEQAIELAAKTQFD